MKMPLDTLIYYVELYDEDIAKENMGIFALPLNY
jgi:hypothetical protein